MRSGLIWATGIAIEDTGDTMSFAPEAGMAADLKTRSLKAATHITCGSETGQRCGRRRPFRHQ